MFQCSFQKTDTQNRDTGRHAHKRESPYLQVEIRTHFLRDFQRQETESDSQVGTKSLLSRRDSGSNLAPRREISRRPWSSLRPPGTSPRVAAGYPLTHLSITLPSILDKEFIALTSSDDCKLNPKVPNSNRACSEKHRQKQNLTSKNGL